MLESYRLAEDAFGDTEDEISSLSVLRVGTAYAYNTERIVKKAYASRADFWNCFETPRHETRNKEWCDCLVSFASYLLLETEIQPNSCQQLYDTEL